RKQQAGEDAGLGCPGWPGEDVHGDRGAARRGCDDRLVADEGRHREAAGDCAEVRYRDQIASLTMFPAERAAEPVLQPTAAVILVWWSFLSFSAAAAADLGYSARQDTSVEGCP